MIRIFEKVPACYLLALTESGVCEVPGNRAHSARVLEYHATTTLKAKDDETPWCSAFANFCCHETGFERSNSAAARSWLGIGLRLLDKPTVGCIVVLSDDARGPKSGHVGFYHFDQGRDKNYITLWGGNQGNSVCSAEYSRDRVLAFLEPREDIPF